jgi:hypothetical protein
MTTKHTGGVSQCGACGLIFKSVHAFDAHRVGKHGVNRRCMTVTELRASGMEPNQRGQWRKPCGDFEARHATAAA